MTTDTGEPDKSESEFPKTTRKAHTQPKPSKGEFDWPGIPAVPTTQIESFQTLGDIKRNYRRGGQRKAPTSSAGTCN